MEEKKLSTGVPQRSIIYLLICGTGILAFVLAGIYPSYRNMVRMDGSIADLKAQIEEQKILFPIYQNLRQGLTQEALNAQSNPLKSGLPARLVDNLSPIFSEIAANCGLLVSAVTPDVKSLTNDSHFLSVDLTLKGNLFDLRKFLLELAGLPYLEDIEKLQIREGPDGKEYFLKVLLMIDNPRPAAA